MARELTYQLQDSGATYLICVSVSLDTGYELRELNDKPIIREMDIGRSLPELADSR